MKKIILAAMIAVFSVSANAQVWVGGDFGFGFSKADSDAKTANKITVSPQVGYMLNDKFGIYADVNFDSYKGALTNDKALSSFGFDVAARYIFAKSGIASFFIDGGVGMNFFNKSRGNVMGIVFVPGIKIAASEKVELVARLGGIGARFGNKKAQESGAAPKSEYGLNVQNSAISFGVAYNF